MCALVHRNAAVHHSLSRSSLFVARYRRRVCVCMCLLQNWLAHKCNMYRYNTFSSVLHVTAALLRSFPKMNVHHSTRTFADSTNHSAVCLHQEKNYTSGSPRTKPRMWKKQKQSCNENENGQVWLRKKKKKYYSASRDDDLHSHEH